MTRTASKKPPVANPPQLVIIMSDDNWIPEGTRWMAQALGATRNTDGSKRYMSFYANYEHPDIHDPALRAPMLEAIYDVYQMGHEIGNHTSTHLLCVSEDGKKVAKDIILADITKVEKELIGLGIPKAHIQGFRTPYLQCTDLSFEAMAQVGFLYDASLTADKDSTAGNGCFPYTLDTLYGELYKGIWEIPNSSFAVHPQDRAYAAERGPGEHIMGLDWNMWNELEFNAEQTLRSWTYTLDGAMAGNRAPFVLGLHSQFYIEPKDIDFPNIRPHERREVFLAFIEYASKLQDVFFVSADMAVRWMQQPVSAGEFCPLPAIH
jgi:peptidoglycan/xylan/chitin deacetylase (PgdA/CDA1 family)